MAPVRTPVRARRRRPPSTEVRHQLPPDPLDVHGPRRVGVGGFRTQGSVGFRRLTGSGVASWGFVALGLWGDCVAGARGIGDCRLWGCKGCWTWEFRGWSVQTNIDIHKPVKQTKQSDKTTIKQETSFRAGAVSPACRLGPTRAGHQDRNRGSLRQLRTTPHRLEVQIERGGSRNLKVAHCSSSMTNSLQEPHLPGLNLLFPLDVVENDSWHAIS